MAEKIIDLVINLISIFHKIGKFMPTIEQFIENFLEAVDFQETVNVTPETELRSLPEWDSLAALGVIVMFDVEFSKNIIGDDLKDCITVNDLYKLLG